MNLGVTLAGLPEGWRVTGLPGRPFQVDKGKSVQCNLSVESSSIPASANRMNVEVRGGDKPIVIPVTLIAAGTRP